MNHSCISITCTKFKQWLFCKSSKITTSNAISSSTLIHIRLYPLLTFSIRLVKLSLHLSRTFASSHQHSRNDEWVFLFFGGFEFFTRLGFQLCVPRDVLFVINERLSLF